MHHVQQAPGANLDGHLVAAGDVDGHWAVESRDLCGHRVGEDDISVDHVRELSHVLV